METLKANVIRRFLDFVSGYIPLEQARLATLGGVGLEARIWAEMGIPQDNGWLIERSRTLVGKLIQNHEYHIQNQLGTLHRTLTGAYGQEQAFIDAFHLDLCGTLHPSMEDFEDVLPLVLKSTGRCLAITVADARGNTALENWPTISSRAKWHFGPNANVYERLLLQQQQIPVRDDLPEFMQAFDPEKAAKRECAVLVDLVSLLSRQAKFYTIASMGRYVYVSRLKNLPFRMRTYFFRFEISKSRRDKATREFAEHWIESPLYFGNESSLHLVGTEVQADLQPEPQLQLASIISTQEEILMGLSKGKTLADLVQLVGNPEIIAEYTQLLAESVGFRHLLDTIEQVKNKLPLELSSPTSDSSGSDESTGSTLTAKIGNLRKPTATAWSELNPHQQIEFQIGWLEFKTANPEASRKNGEWREYVEKTFLEYTPKLGMSLRSAIAQTSGSFRKALVERIKHTFDTEAEPYLKRLAKIPETPVYQR